MAHCYLPPRGAMAYAWTTTTRVASLFKACLARPEGEVAVLPWDVASNAEAHGSGRNPALQHALASQIEKTHSAGAAAIGLPDLSVILLTCNESCPLLTLSAHT